MLIERSSRDGATVNTLQVSDAQQAERHQPRRHDTTAETAPRRSVGTVPLVSDKFSKHDDPAEGGGAL
jgi:hypothetical protein